MNFRGVRLSDKLLLFYIRRIPNHPFKLRLVNCFNDWFFENAVQIKTQQHAIFKISTREQTGLGLIVDDHYEPLTLATAKSILRDGGVFFDIGANIGLISIVLGQIKNVTVYAVEPSVGIFTRLLENLQLSDAMGVVPINIALSGNNSFGYLYNQHPQNLGTMKVIEEVQNGAYLIRLCPLSDLVKFLSVQTIQLMKIDVEGYELNVLKGLFDTKCPVRPQNLIVEFNDLVERTGYSQLAFLSYVLSQGYAAFNVMGEPYVWTDPLPESNLWFKLTSK